LIYLKDIMTNVTECLHPESTIAEAITFMKQTKWNTVPVTNKESKLIGVFTRSILYQLVLDSIPLDTPIKHYIKDALSLPLDTSYEEVERIVKNSRVGTGIVTDNQSRVIGVFTKTDMISALFRATESLKEQLEIILHTSELGAFLTDNKGSILYANERLLSMMDLTEEGLLGKKMKKVFAFKKDKKGRVITPQKIDFRRHQTILRLSDYLTLKGDSGHIGMFQNISEIRKMAEELETIKELKGLLDTVIENAYDGIVTIDKAGTINLINPSMLELFKLKRDDALGNNINQILPQLELTKVIESGTADVSDLMEIDGIKYLIHRIPVIHEGNIIGAIGKIMFRQLHEVRAMFKQIDIKENRLANLEFDPHKTESSRFTMEQIITNDAYMEKLKRIAHKAAKGKSTIILRGESGTGKELFAHAIHSISERRNGPFVTVNCAAIPDHLLESEFFGYDEGAFTGAKRKGKIGKFDLANGGTLFLDEIGDMSSHLQAKLLRVLQEKEFYRVGGNERIKVDIRIISATNKSLEDMVKKGTFREDLFYRLNVISIEIPPLRKRKDDILLLSELFIREMNNQIGTTVTGIEANAKATLLSYNWPGNIRELKNVIEHAITFSEFGKLKLADLPDYIIENSKITIELAADNLLKKAEQETIEQALLEANGNKSKAAKILGISRSVLYAKLDKSKSNN